MMPISGTKEKPYQTRVSCSIHEQLLLIVRQIVDAKDDQYRNCHTYVRMILGAQETKENVAKKGPQSYHA